MDQKQITIKYIPEKTKKKSSNVENKSWALKARNNLVISQCWKGNFQKKISFKKLNL